MVTSTKNYLRHSRFYLRFVQNPVNFIFDPRKFLSFWYFGPNSASANGKHCLVYYCVIHCLQICTADGNEGGRIHLIRWQCGTHRLWCRWYWWWLRCSSLLTRRPSNWTIECAHRIQVIIVEWICAINASLGWVSWTENRCYRCHTGRRWHYCWITCLNCAAIAIITNEIIVHLILSMEEILVIKCASYDASKIDHFLDSHVNSVLAMSFGMLCRVGNCWPSQHQRYAAFVHWLWFGCHTSHRHAVALEDFPMFDLCQVSMTFSSAETISKTFFHPSRGRTRE